MTPRGIMRAADAMFTGTSASNYSGWSTSIIADTNGDPLDEILVGAPQEDTSGSSAGAAYLFLGAGLSAELQTPLSPSLIW